MTEGPSMNGAGDVTVVVTTHNARATLPSTAACLRALRGVAKVIVVDSGSSDGTPELAATLLPGARIEALTSNVGPCVTRNIGLAAAETARVLFVDDDMGFEADIVERLSTALDAHPDCVAAGPTIVFDDRPDAIQYAGGRMHFGGLPHLYSLGEKPDPSLPPEAKPNAEPAAPPPGQPPLPPLKPLPGVPMMPELPPLQAPLVQAPA